MSVKTSIGWCTRTINPIKGCRNACWATAEHPEGNCYAACMARRNLTRCARCHDFADVHPHLEVLEQVRKWRKPQRIFCGSATDLWSEGVEQEWRDAIFECVRDTPQHTWIVLTKRPEEISLDDDIRHGNLVMGVSVTNPVLDEGRFLNLRRRRASHWHVRPKLAVSFEPFICDGRTDAYSWSAIAREALVADWWIFGAPTGVVAGLHPVAPSLMTISLLTMLAWQEYDGQPHVYLKNSMVRYLPRWMDVDQYRRLEDGTVVPWEGDG